MNEIDIETLHLAATYISLLPDPMKGYDIIILPRQDGMVSIISPAVTSNEGVEKDIFPNFDFIEDAKSEKQEIERIIDVLKGLL